MDERDDKVCPQEALSIVERFGWQEGSRIKMIDSAGREREVEIVRLQRNGMSVRDVEALR